MCTYQTAYLVGYVLHAEVFVLEYLCRYSLVAMYYVSWCRVLYQSAIPW